MKLTPEQDFALDQFRRGVHLKVIAFAGAGKTSTLTAMARDTNRRGLYLAFNKSIVVEATGKFPANVTAKTAHSLAFGATVGMGYKTTKMTTLLRRADVHNYLKTNARKLDVTTEEQGEILIAATIDTLRRYCQSWDVTVGEHHVPFIPGLEEDDMDWLREKASIMAQGLWERMSDKTSTLPLGHDGYVKLWALSNPRLPGDFIMVDEAQDLNPVLIGVIRNQSTQIIAVGDSHQQIYAWRGAKDALNILGGTEARLTQSFRFGNHIAAAADKVLVAMGEEHPLRGFDAVSDVVTTEPSQGDVDAVLARSNAGVIDIALQYLDAGRKVWTPGGMTDLKIQVEDARRLQSGQSAKTLELMGFRDWSAVVEHSKRPDGREYTKLVSLVEKFGTQRLLEVIEQFSSQDKAPNGAITVSTGHKAKGLEWNRVALSGDFYVENPSLAERRLFYVAMTRAKNVLYTNNDLMRAFTQPLSEE